EGQRLGGFIGNPGGCEARRQDSGVLGGILHQVVVKVGVDFAGRKFIGLSGIERDDVVDILRDNQRIGGGRSVNGASCQRQGERSRHQGGAKELHERFSLGLIFFRTG